MPVKIRLTRHGRKGRPYYHIVIADSRAPRDGKYIERIGSYNPITNPATINLNFEKALEWLQNGAQPTDTCRAILSYKGVMMKKHLLEGVKKGAFDEAAAESKFEAWMKDKEAKIAAKEDKLSKDASDEIKKRFEAETKVSSDRGEALAKKLAKAAAKESSEDVSEEIAVAEPKVEEPKAEEPKVEKPKAEEAKVEKPKAEEPKAEEAKVEKPKAEEAKAEEPKTDETKA